MSQGKQCKNQYSSRKAVGLCDTATIAGITECKVKF